MTFVLSNQVTSIYKQRVERYLNLKRPALFISLKCNLCGCLLSYKGVLIEFYYIAPHSDKLICNDCLQTCSKCGNTHLKLYDLDLERNCDSCVYNETIMSTFKNIPYDIHYYIVKNYLEEQYKLIKKTIRDLKNE